MQLSDKALLRTQAYIDGAWVDSDSGDTVAVTNPANGEVSAEIASCGTAETRRAIEKRYIAALSRMRKRSQWKRAPKTDSGTETTAPWRQKRPATMACD